MKSQTDRFKTYQAYDNELNEITEKLNLLKAQEIPLHKRYEYIMQYFRQQKCRGLITEEQYRMRADKFKWVKKRGRKKLK